MGDERVHGQPVARRDPGGAGGADRPVGHLRRRSHPGGRPASEAATEYEERTTGPNHQTVPMGDTFVTSGGATEIRQWDTATGRLLAEVAMDPKRPAPLLALPDGSAVYYPDADGVIRRFLVDIADVVALAEARVRAGSPRPSASGTSPPATAQHPTRTDRSRVHRSGVGGKRRWPWTMSVRSPGRVHIGRAGILPWIRIPRVVLASDSVLPPELDDRSHHL